MVDFGALPPDINSARMYAGPGSSSLQAAASAWNGLAAELSSAATSYDKVVTQLASDEWMGPASASMASAAQPYVSWMSTTAAQAEQAATQARSAAAAYEQAFAATMPPPLVAANRAETAAAVQANVFGQYTPLIAQLEAQYGEMWAQDSSAMYAYAGQSAAAAQVTPFASPAATTDPAGTATQAAAVSSATGTSAATSSQTILQELISLLPSNIQALLTPSGLPKRLRKPVVDRAVAVRLHLRDDCHPDVAFSVCQRLRALRKLLVQHRGSALLQRWYGQLRRSDGEDLGRLGGAPAAAGAGAGAAAGGLGGLGGMLGGGGGGCCRTRRSRRFGQCGLDRQIGGATVVDRRSSADGPTRPAADQ